MYFMDRSKLPKSVKGDMASKRICILWTDRSNLQKTGLKKMWLLKECVFCVQIQADKTSLKKIWLLKEYVFYGQIDPSCKNRLKEDMASKRICILWTDPSCQN